MYMFCYLNKLDTSIVGIRGNRKPYKRKTPYIVNAWQGYKNPTWGMEGEIYWSQMCKNLQYIGRFKIKR